MNAIIIHSINPKTFDDTKCIRDFQEFLSLNDDEIAVLDGRLFRLNHSLRYDRCTLKTKLIVVRWLHENFDFDAMLRDVIDGIQVERQMKPTFYIKPKFLLLTEHTPHQLNYPKGSSFKNRFLAICHSEKA